MFIRRLQFHSSLTAKTSCPDIQLKVLAINTKSVLDLSLKLLPLMRSYSLYVRNYSQGS